MEKKLRFWNTAALLKQIPRPVLIFLSNALIAFIIWKALYLFWLQPIQKPDRFLVKNIAAQTCRVLNFFLSGHPYSAISATVLFRDGDYTQLVWVGKVFYNGNSVLSIHPFCDGLELMVLYLGFIICFPSSLKRKVWFSILGVISIYGINVLRCIGLVIIVNNSDLRKWFDFAHHYLFVIVVYGLIFLLWIWFVNSSLRHQSRLSKPLPDEIA